VAHRLQSSRAEELLTMNHRSLARRFAFAVPALALAVAIARPAGAEETSIGCSNGQFADHLEAGKPVGDAASIGAAKKAVYWVDVANTGAPTQVTLVWSLDGQEVQRQLLDVGTSGHWHTWGTRPLGKASTVAVKLLRADGTTMKEDSIALPAVATEPAKPAS
jgi:hypothetical protein